MKNNSVFKISLITMLFVMLSNSYAVNLGSNVKKATIVCGLLMNGSAMAKSNLKGSSEVASLKNDRSLSKNEVNCKKLCLKESSDLKLEFCSMDSSNELTCSYKGTNGSSNCSCPTDDEIGSGFWFNNKNCKKEVVGSSVTCNYVKVGDESEETCRSLCLDQTYSGHVLNGCYKNYRTDDLTCSYSGNNVKYCCSCPTDEEIGSGFWFDNKKCKNDCDVTCNYERVGEPDEETCRSLCMDETSQGHTLTGCYTNHVKNELTCSYTGEAGRTCCSCPTDDEIGNDYYFNNKDCQTDSEESCDFTCKYNKD